MTSENTECKKRAVVFVQAKLMISQMREDVLSTVFQTYKTTLKKSLTGVKGHYTETNIKLHFYMTQFV